MKTPEAWAKVASMIRKARIATALPTVFALGLPAPSEARRWEDGVCFYSLADVPRPPRFQDYPATQRPIARPAPPRLIDADARRFRTRIRFGAARGPVFAGPYRIAAWGCGTSCTNWAMIDGRTGRIIYPNGVSTIWAGRVDGFRLIFRPDSRLIVVLGTPQEDETRAGALFLEWTGTAFRRLRFVPATTLCGNPPAGSE